MATLVVNIDPSGAQAGARQVVRSMDDMKRKATEVDQATDRLGRTANDNMRQMSAGANLATAGFSKLRAAVIGVAAAAGGLIGGALALRQFISGTMEAQKVQAQLAAALRSTNSVSGQTIASLNAHAAALQRLTTHGDEAIGTAQGLLLTFTKIRGDVFPQATEAVLNVATALGGDLKGAALQVGKALNDPLLGMTALGRAGIQFTATQKAMVKQFMEVGDILSAQKIILKELETQFGGSAAAMRGTLGGAISSLSNAWGDLFELGSAQSEGLRKAVESLITAIQDPAFVTFIQTIGIGLVTAMSAAAQGINAVVKAVSFLVDNLDTLAVAAGTFLAIMSPAILAGIATGLIAVGTAGVAAVRAITVAMAANPIGAIAIGITAAITALYYFRDEIKSVLGVDVVGLAKDAANFIINSFVAAYEDVKLAWSFLPDALMEIGYDAGYNLKEALRVKINEVIMMVDSLIMRINENLGSNIDRSWLKTIMPEPNENPYRGSASKWLEERVKMLEEVFGTDRIGGWVKAITKAFRSGEEAAAGLDEKLKGLPGNIEEAGDAAIEASEKFKSFQQVADGLAEKLFPAEYARREAAELFSLLEQYGQHLTDLQRIAVQNEIGNLFTAADLGLRRLDDNAETSAQKMGSLFSEVGSILAGIFDQPIESLWDFVDQVIAAIGQIGQKLMSLYEFDWGKVFSGGSSSNGDLSLPNFAPTPTPAPAKYTEWRHSDRFDKMTSGLERTATSLASVTTSYQNAIKKIESGGNYGAIGPTSPTLGRALGAYQVMEANVGPWSQQTFGQSMTASDFLRNPAAQDAIFDKIFGGYVQRFGEAGAAQAWFAGPGGVGKTNRTDVLGTSVGKYGQMFMQSLGNSTPSTASGAPALSIAPVSGGAAPATGLGVKSGSGGTWSQFAAIGGAAASGLASGYQSENPLMGAISGALGGMGAGPWGMAAGLLGGLIGGIIGLKKATDEARTELKRLAPEMETFFKIGSGQGVSSMAESLREYTDKAKEYAKIADKARDFETLDKLTKSILDFEETLKGDFRLGFGTLIQSLSEGQGLDGELVQAQQAVLSLREELKTFVADAEFVYGSSSAQVAQARAAAQQQLLATISKGGEPLSDVAFEVQRLSTILPSLREALSDFGLSGVHAENAIRDHLIKAIEDLRRGFEDDLTASLNELTGRGYLNKIADAQKQYNDRLSDATALGLDGSGALEELGLSLLAIQKEAGASNKELLAFSNSIGGVEGLFRDVLSDAVTTLRQVLDVWKDFVDRIAEYQLSSKLNPSTSTLSPQERLDTARSEYERIRDLARGGNRDAMGKVVEAVTAYRDQAGSFYSSSGPYAGIFAETDEALGELKDQGLLQISAAEQQLLYAEQSVSGLSVANDTLLTLVTATENVRDALDAYLGSGGTLEASIQQSAMAALVAAQSATATVTQSVEAVAEAIRGSEGWIAQRMRERGDITQETKDVSLGLENKGFFQKVGDWFADLFGFANGGSFTVGGSGGIDSQLVAFRASPNEQVTIETPEQSRNRYLPSSNDNRELARILLQGFTRLETAEDRGVEEAAAMRAEFRLLKEEMRLARLQPGRATGRN